MQYNPLEVLRNWPRWKMQLKTSTNDATQKMQLISIARGLHQSQKRMVIRIRLVN
jgi:hypothetical protein